MSVAESYQGEPRNLDEWLTLEGERVAALLGRQVLTLHGHLDARAHHLMAVANAIAFVHDAPISPRATLRTLASGLRETMASLEARQDGRLSFSGELYGALCDARVFLGHVERLLDWVANG